MSYGNEMAENSWIGQAVYNLSRTLDSKNEDYRIDGEFSNFEYAAELAGLNVTDVMLTQLGIKLGRLKGLADDPNNESRLDTVKDLAGYAILFYAYSLRAQEPEGERGGYAEPELVPHAPDDVARMPGDALEYDEDEDECQCSFCEEARRQYG